MMIAEDIDLSIEIEILKRLPVKSICRFRCVCKSWNSIISSTFFINLHHSASSIAPPHQKSYLIFDSAKTNLIICNPIHPPHLTNLTYPIKPLKFVSSPLIDVIHGIVFVSYSLSSFFDFTILWNPSIHRYLTLPTPSRVERTEKENSFYFRVGFGFDSSNNDFKVVRVWNRFKESKSLPNELCSEVYSSREGVWRKKKGFDNIMAYESHGFTTRSGCFCNGSLHWFVSTPNVLEKYSVLVFDCVEEVFREMKLPEEANQMMNGNTRLIRFVEYLEKLAVVLYSIDDRFVKMWKMEEDGVWIKLSTVFEGVPMPVSCYGVLMLIKDGDIITFQNWEMEEIVSTVLNKNGCVHWIASCKFITNVGFFQNGCVHWIASIVGKYSVLMFDCGEEVFRKRDIPEEAEKILKSNSVYNVAKFAEFLGKLVLVITYRIEGFVEMWMMDEQGVSIKVCSEGNPKGFGVVMLIEEGNTIKIESWDSHGAFDCSAERFHKPLEGRLFEESMFLMDVYV